jgi:hypothetical protein
MDQVAPLVTAARASRRATLRAADPVDGETYTDVFPLANLGEVIDAVAAGCKH